MHEKWNLKTYCDILGVSENSPQYEIHAAYKKAKQLYSMDNPKLTETFSKEEAVALENLVEEAFAILGNHSLRSIYQRKNELKVNKNPTNPKDKLDTPFKLGDYTIDEGFENEIKKNGNYCGSTLKKIREYKGISIKQLSEITKVKATYIVAIEEDDFSCLPATVYTRGFIVQIAKVLELDPNTVATSYIELYKSANDKS